MQDYQYSNKAKEQAKNANENEFAEALGEIADAVGDAVIGVGKFALFIIGIAAAAVGIESLGEMLDV